MLHKEIFGLILLGFVVWVFVAMNGSARIERGCRPVGWAGSVAVSLTALALPNQQGAVVRWTQKAEYSCQYAIWRLIYQDDYNRAPAAPPMAARALPAEEAPASNEGAADKPEQ